jgi:glycosyltransferase involved in cell wall biosynthesis
MSRLRVLLVPDFFNWVLGDWVKEIVKNGKQHDYYFFSQQAIDYYPREWESLVNQVDLVHTLTDVNTDRLIIPKHIPRIGSIHHVVEWEDVANVAQTSDAIAVMSREWQEYLQQKEVLPEKIHLLPYGIDTNKFYPVSDRRKARAALGIYSNTFLIGYSAKYTSDAGGRKGLDVLLASLKMLASRGQKFGVVLTGPGWSKVVKQLHSYGISEVYYFPFLAEKKMPIYHNALSAYLTTSKVEGGPVPVFKSMVCGVPVVTTPVGMVNDYIKNGINGLIVPKGDAEATAKAIEQLINSSQSCAKLAEAGLQTIATHLTWEKVLTGIEPLYQQIWQEKTQNHQLDRANKLLDSIKQRDLALKRDAHLWNLKLCYRGHLKEGLRGMFADDPRIIFPQTAKVIATEISLLRKKQDAISS